MCFFLHTLTGEKWHENDAKNGMQNAWQGEAFGTRVRVR